ncbi:DUF1564 domain-containing protein [Leptospira gomenensis]|uniref:DUF1564 domain-containing protein n=1 Tax=Leptospira gomenensis TaxID=2484974 RepID=A0A5F1Z0A1_9LEPT|nr:DUF1564 domain-containing protein [Leptospira gomenensis]TGK34949.1 DUF1564 domain-containing protein [Leptospira gomenensis]TGK36745.1 DUF1564 domain-containing protein [Leptospira gomenensis]TGK48850.1 DUF1564 domain-containing protein [Leptospira gomenensis]TGK64616.1 DUF1564 domain-containing protein [Leptospira gomenensis]
MGVLVLSSDHTIDSVLRERESEIVTLLVPEETLSLYPEEDRKDLPKRIPGLLAIYGKYMTSIPRIGKKAGRTLYQPSEGKKKMVRINVRLNSGTWSFLGMLAHVHGVSRCFLFNYLLSLDRVGVGESIVLTMNDGGPTFHRNYSYILHLDLQNNRITRSLKCQPESTFYVIDYLDWFDP